MNALKKKKHKNKSQFFFNNSKITSNIAANIKRYWTLSPNCDVLHVDVKAIIKLLLIIPQTFKN